MQFKVDVQQCTVKLMCSVQCEVESGEFLLIRLPITAPPPGRGGEGGEVVSVGYLYFFAGISSYCELDLRAVPKKLIL